MSGRGNCYDNSMVEMFFKTIKSELIWPVAWQAFIARLQEPHCLRAKCPGSELNALHKTRASPADANRRLEFPNSEAMPHGIPLIIIGCSAPLGYISNDDEYLMHVRRMVEASGMAFTIHTQYGRNRIRNIFSFEC